ncbi:hypothetical protein ACQP1O_43120 (plasmid) [Nocardia sp. CA-151230]|uniref:hypothetical protein n=1 Tax=Nocardia sp. CA-151230 TaxID=3239982 RepID=UPI003D8A89EA
MAITDLGVTQVRLLAQAVGSSEPPIEIGTVDIPVRAVGAEGSITVRCVDCPRTAQMAIEYGRIPVAPLKGWGAEGDVPRWRCPEHSR